MSARIPLEQLLDRLRALSTPEAAARASATRDDELFQRRAERLLVPVEAPANEEGTELVVFSTTLGRFAVDAAHVAEVARPAALAPVPFAPDWLPLIARIRGGVVGLLDLARFVGQGGEPVAGAPFIVLLNPRRVGVALIATDVDSRVLPASERQPPPSGLNPALSALVEATTADGALILNLQTLLSDPRLNSHG